MIWIVRVILVIAALLGILASGGVLPPVSRNTLILSASLSVIKISPLGAVSKKRGLTKPLEYSSILKPSGTRGCAPEGRRITRASFWADLVAYGGAKSSRVTLCRTPGASCVQSAVTEAFRSGLAPFAAQINEIADTKRQGNRSRWREIRNARSRYII